MNGVPLGRTRHVYRLPVRAQAQLDADGRLAGTLSPRALIIRTPVAWFFARMGTRPHRNDQKTGGACLLVLDYRHALRLMTSGTAPTPTTSPPSWCNNDNLNRVSSLADPHPGA